MICFIMFFSDKIELSIFSLLTLCSENMTDHIIIKVKDFDVNKVTFGIITHGKNGMNLYDILYDEKNFILQTEVMTTQFGLSKYTVYEMTKYFNTWSIDMSTINESKTLENKLKQLQEIIKNKFNTNDVFPFVNEKNAKFKPFIKVKIDHPKIVDKDIKKGSEIMALVEFPKLFQTTSTYFMPLKLCKIKLM